MVGVDADHEDLAETSVARTRRMDLRPAEPCESRRIRRPGEEEAVGVEPGFAHPALEGRGDPSALFGVVPERTVVHAQPVGLVDAGPEGSHGDAVGPASRFVDGEPDAHLEEVARGREARGGRVLVVRVGRVEDPQHDLTVAHVAVVLDVLDHPGEQVRRGRVGAMVGFDHDPGRPVRRREVVARHDVHVSDDAPAVGREDTGGSGLAAGLEVTPDSGAERLVTIGSGRSFVELPDRVEIRGRDRMRGADLDHGGNGSVRAG